MKRLTVDQGSARGSEDRQGSAAKIIGITLIVVFALAACGTAVAEEPKPNTAGEPAPPVDFQITVYRGDDILGGQDVTLSQVLSQGKPLVLNFWAGLCPPCRLEMPDLQRVHERFSHEIVLFGLDIGPFTALGTTEDGKRLVESLGITYPTGTTVDTTVVQAYQIAGMPSTYFINPKGEILRKWTGLLTEEKMTELVQELLELSATS
jgi:thiol-disulfide isomerase/thioredoxin